ncbi:MAG: alkaline phosphatase family protein [Terriglobales bacterium]
MVEQTLRTGAVGSVLFLALTLLAFSTGPAAPSSHSVPAFDHVVLVLLENEAYDEIIGNREMPYLNELARRHALATNYYANSHPSIGNYFMMTAGQLITRDDSYSSTVREDNVVRRLMASGKSWRSYAEDLPGVGYTGGNRHPYVRRHNPLSFFSDVVENPAQRRNLVPFSQLANDLASGSLPNYAFVVPNNIHNLHSCPAGGNSCTEEEQMRLADAWLRDNIEPLLENKNFRENGLLLILFDESEPHDNTHGGGRIPVILVGSKVKPGYRSKTFYQHESVLRLTCAALRLENCPGAGATAPTMEEFFRQ